MLRGVRHFFRQYTAMAVREHLRSEIEGRNHAPELTVNEVELVRFVLEGRLDWHAYLAGRS